MFLNDVNNKVFNCFTLFVANIIKCTTLTKIHKSMVSRMSNMVLCPSVRKNCCHLFTSLWRFVYCEYFAVVLFSWKKAYCENSKNKTTANISRFTVFVLRFFIFWLMYRFTVLNFPFGIFKLFLPLQEGEYHRVNDLGFYACNVSHITSKFD